jgi:alkanesulfonate monooxygenase SsuD/methylene tetrahydromethanopterin reductase-like flavin-dependent oxidoreductase (luciferase family)
MDIGVALPQMAPDYGPDTTVRWSRGIDDGPFSSVSAGERVTFTNPEMVASLAAAAAVTERVRVMTNVWVLPQHPPAMVAQQIGTLDQLSHGRLTVAVGVGGREEDYRALDSPLERRHQRLDEAVAELRRLLDGGPAYDGGDPVGPRVVQPGGVPILAGALGPKAMARAARWADGVSGFSVAGAERDFHTLNRLADDAWAAADRGTPRKVNGFFYCLGVEDPLPTLRAFTERYLGFLGPELAAAMAAEVHLADTGGVRRALDDAEAAGCDEIVLVPASADPACLEAAAEVVAGR